MSMFTAGTSPASTVRATSDSNPSQSTAPSAVNGNKTADMPRIGRRRSAGGAGHAGSSRATNASSWSRSAGGRERRTLGCNRGGIVRRAHCARQPVLTGRHRRHECRHDGVRPHDVGVGTQRDHGCVTRRTIVTPKVDDRRAAPRRRHDGTAALGHLGRWWCRSLPAPTGARIRSRTARGRDRSRRGGRARARARRR